MLKMIPIQKIILAIFVLLLIPAAYAIPYPPSTYCENMGYTFEIEGDTEYCVFPDGYRCPAWEFLDGNCGQEYVKELPCAEIGHEASEGIKCCEGLRAISNYRISADGYCEGDVTHWAKCYPCGNGVCEADFEENVCSCPEDCAPKENNETNETKCYTDIRGSLNFCSTDCLCGDYEGDCDFSGECEPGLVCNEDAGSESFFDSWVDLCKPSADICSYDVEVVTSGTTIISPAMPGRACNPMSNVTISANETYEVSLIGYQTITVSRIVDATIEVTRHDNLTEEVTTGLSGVAVVGNISMELLPDNSGDSNFTYIRVKYLPDRNGSCESPVYEISSDRSNTVLPFDFGSNCTVSEDEIYMLNMIGFQKISNEEVLDATLGVTRPDGVVEQVTAESNKIVTVGDIEIELIEGSAIPRGEARVQLRVKHLADEDACQQTIVVATNQNATVIPMNFGPSCRVTFGGGSYKVKLVGYQTINGSEMVDVTLEVTRPDNVSERVVAGISGTARVGELKIRLVNGTNTSQNGSVELAVELEVTQTTDEGICQYPVFVSSSGETTIEPIVFGRSCEPYPKEPDESYSIRLVGYQTIEGEVVDITLNVTDSGGNSQEVTTGISGTAWVGTLQIRLIRATESSNVITGEKSVSADLRIKSYGAIPTGCRGDLNGDGIIDQTDIDIFNVDIVGNNYSLSGTSIREECADMNMDGYVSEGDLKCIDLLVTDRYQFEQAGCPPVTEVVNPGCNWSEEVCDGVDNNCDGEIDAVVFIGENYITGESYSYVSYLRRIVNGTGNTRIREICIDGEWAREGVCERVENCSTGQEDNDCDGYLPENDNDCVREVWTYPAAKKYHRAKCHTFGECNCDARAWCEPDALYNPAEHGVEGMSTSEWDCELMETVYRGNAQDFVDRGIEPEYVATYWMATHVDELSGILGDWADDFKEYTYDKIVEYLGGTDLAIMTRAYLPEQMEEAFESIPEPDAWVYVDEEESKRGETAGYAAMAGNPVLLIGYATFSHTIGDGRCWAWDAIYCPESRWVCYHKDYLG